jgi:WXG100 family type VII secretion target
MSQAFNQQADAIAKMNQTLKSCQETLQGGDWIGQGANAFQQEMNGQVMPSLGRLQKALTEAARLTAQMSQIIKQAEQDASGVFHL